MIHFLFDFRMKNNEQPGMELEHNLAEPILVIDVLIRCRLFCWNI